MGDPAWVTVVAFKAQPPAPSGYAARQVWLPVGGAWLRRHPLVVLAILVVVAVVLELAAEQGEVHSAVASASATAAPAAPFSRAELVAAASPGASRLTHSGGGNWRRQPWCFCACCSPLSPVIGAACVLAGVTANTLTPF